MNSPRLLSKPSVCQCASALTFHQLWSNRRLRTPQKWTHCSTWLGCVGSPWNRTTLIWKSGPQRTGEISHVYRTPAVTRWRMSLRFWNIFCFLKVIVRKCIPKFARKVIVIPGLHMQKYFLKCFGNRGKESPLWYSGETEARICIQFGDLIMRKRRDILQEVQRKSTGIIKEPQYLLWRKY